MAYVFNPITGKLDDAGTPTTDASLLTSGTLADARLSANVSLDNINNNFSASQTFSGSANTAPNQTAASGSSLMTRDLTYNNLPLVCMTVVPRSSVIANGGSLNIPNNVAAPVFLSAFAFPLTHTNFSYQIEVSFQSVPLSFSTSAFSMRFLAINQSTTGGNMDATLSGLNLTSTPTSVSQINGIAVAMIKGSFTAPAGWISDATAAGSQFILIYAQLVNNTGGSLTTFAAGTAGYMVISSNRSS